MDTKEEGSFQLLQVGGLTGSQLLHSVKQGTYEQMEKIGVWWPEAHHNAEDMARLAMAAHEVTGVKTARVPFEQSVEAEAAGYKLHFKRDIPVVREQALKDFMNLKLPADFLSLSEPLHVCARSSVLGAPLRCQGPAKTC